MNIISFQVPPFPTFIKAGKDCFQPGKKHFKRVFTVFDLILVKSGTMFMKEDGIDYAVKPGEYIILSPGLEHRGYRPCEEETEFFWIHFSLEVPFKLKSVPDINWGLVLKNEGTYTEPAKHMFHIPRYGRLGNEEYTYHELDRLISLHDSNSPDRRLKEQLIFQVLMMQLQSEAIRIPSSTEHVTSLVIHYIQQHYKEEIKMDDISKSLLFHPDYITRCMQKTIGISPTQYLTNYRLSLAKQLLASTNEKIISIAKQVGIDDPAYFSRLFKKVEGITPLEYRRLVNREGG